MTDQPARYSIAELLNSGVQPFADLPDDDLAALGRSIGKGPLADPVSVSTDGVLLDGHQRLKALAAKGRTYITAADVHVIDRADKGNALEWAVRLNAQRRHLSVEEKAAVARKLQAERRWSQGKIADVFGVSRPAVSQWLAKTGDGSDEPAYVVGRDGKAYDSAPAARPVEKAPRSPWLPDGYAYKAVAKAVRVLQNEPLGGLSPLHLAKLAKSLSDLIEAAENLQNDVEE